MVDGMASFREPSPLTPAACVFADVAQMMVETCLHSELRNTDVFFTLLPFSFQTPHSGQEALALKCSNYSSLPETLTHFLGSNSLVVGFRSKTVFLPLKFLLVVVSTSW
jgi:hypothetical protein